MERTSCKTDFQSWKGIMALKLLCCNIVAGRFRLEEILLPTTLLWSGNLRHTATLLLWTDRLYRVFPLC